MPHPAAPLPPEPGWAEFGGVSSNLSFLPSWGTAGL